MSNPKANTYRVVLDDADMARVHDALTAYADKLHAQIAQARAAGFDDIAQGLYADALSFELLAHRLSNEPSADDVMRMLLGSWSDK